MKGDTVDSYIARVFPCRKFSDPPEACDSWGVCDNCCDATLIRVGAELQRGHGDMKKIVHRDYDNQFIPGKEKMLIDKINELVEKVMELEAKLKAIKNV